MGRRRSLPQCSPSLGAGPSPGAGLSVRTVLTSTVQKPAQSTTKPLSQLMTAE